MVKYLFGWLFVFVIRLLPFRPANVEPLMATLMPYSKRYGWLGGFFFAFLSIVIFDIAGGQVGIWTWVTAGTYGAIGVVAYFFFKNKKGTALRYAGFGIIGTLIFDAITGLGIGPIFYGQPFMEALIGQIPFTIRHVISNGVFALIASPLIDRWIVQQEKLETKAVLGALFPKTQTR